MSGPSDGESWTFPVEAFGYLLSPNSKGSRAPGKAWITRRRASEGVTGHKGRHAGKREDCARLRPSLCSAPGSPRMCSYGVTQVCQTCPPQKRYVPSTC